LGCKYGLLGIIRQLQTAITIILFIFIDAVDFFWYKADSIEDVLSSLGNILLRNVRDRLIYGQLKGQRS